MKTVAAFAAALLTCTATIAGASTTTLLAFGDSLSDSGNRAIAVEAAGFDFPYSIYPNGQFTNGDSFATQLGLDPSLAGGTNYAYGGATAANTDDGVPDLLDQIEAFKASGLDLGAGSAATVWIGGNDFLALDGTESFDEVLKLIDDTVFMIKRGVGKLHRAGVETVLVLGLPDLGILPQYAYDTVASETASFISTLFNNALEAKLAEISEYTNKSDFRFFDTESFLNELLTQVPADLVSVPCLLDPVGCATSPEDYLIYDDIHPSEWVHSLLAEAVAAELGLTPVPLPATLPLLLAGFGGLGIVARRRKSRA